jgi:hypothetical protein
MLASYERLPRVRHPAVRVELVDVELAAHRLVSVVLAAVHDEQQAVADDPAHRNTATVSNSSGRESFISSVIAGETHRFVQKKICSNREITKANIQWHELFSHNMTQKWRKHSVCARY